MDHESARPSAWVSFAKRYSPQVFPSSLMDAQRFPTGPKGRFAAVFLPRLSFFPFWGIWNFCQERPGGQGACWCISRRPGSALPRRWWRRSRWPLRLPIALPSSTVTFKTCRGRPAEGGRSITNHYPTTQFLPIHADPSTSHQVPCRISGPRPGAAQDRVPDSTKYTATGLPDQDDRAQTARRKPDGKRRPFALGPRAKESRRPPMRT